MRKTQIRQHSDEKGYSEGKQIVLRVIKIAALDTSDMPWFAHSMRSFEDTTTSAIIDVGLLGFFSLAAFICAFVRFLWYDVR